MDFKKFNNIKDFFHNFLSKEKSNMNTFIDLYAVDAVIECIENGYILNKKEEKKFMEVLLANNVTPSDIEKLIVKKLPDKYIYNVLAENYPKFFENKKEENKNMPKTQQWLQKKTDRQIAIHLIANWKNNFEHILAFKNKKDIEKKIQQLKNYEHYMLVLPEQPKQQLVDFLNKKINTYSTSFFLHQLDLNNELQSLLKIIDTLQTTDNVKEQSFNDIMKRLNEQNEIEVIQSLEKINKQYQLLFLEFNNMHIIKKNAVIDLYNKSLVSALNQYVEISKKYRNKNINNKTAKSIILENIHEVQDIFDKEVQQIQEEKLMNLSSKSEYLSQLKKQW